MTFGELVTLLEAAAIGGGLLGLVLLLGVLTERGDR